MYFDKVLSEKDLIVWQLRFIYPKLNWNDLVKLYWIWKTPNYLKAWVEDKLTKNIYAARVAEQRLIELELLEESEDNRVNDKTPKGRKTKRKTLLSPILGVLKGDETIVTFKLKLDESNTTI